MHGPTRKPLKHVNFSNGWTRNLTEIACAKGWIITTTWAELKVLLVIILEMPHVRLYYINRTSFIVRQTRRETSNIFTSWEFKFLDKHLFGADSGWRAPKETCLQDFVPNLNRSNPNRSSLLRSFTTGIFGQPVTFVVTHVSEVNTVLDRLWRNISTSFSVVQFFRIEMQSLLWRPLADLFKTIPKCIHIRVMPQYPVLRLGSYGHNANGIMFSATGEKSSYKPL